MEYTIQDHSQRKMDILHIPLAAGIIRGLICGLAATLAMDLVLISVFAVSGLPALSCFSIVGDTIARLFSAGGNAMASNISLGIAAHYFIGPLFGALFGGSVVKINGLQTHSLMKSILHAIAYAEILSQPLLALTPILLKMPAPMALLWFGGSFGFHLLWGIVLGVMMNCWDQRDQARSLRRRLLSLPN